VQEQAPNHLKLQRSRAAVVSVEEKAGLRSCQVESKEMSASELLRTCRKGLGDVKTGGIFVNPGLVWGLPVYCPHGVRHEGSMTLLWASVRNVGTVAPRSRTRDEGRPLGVDVPAQAPNPLTLLCAERAR
jgi:hypothetical protein